MPRKARTDRGQRHNARQVPPIVPLPEPEKLAPDALRHVLQCCRTAYLPDRTPNFIEFAALLMAAQPPDRPLELNIDRTTLSEIENGRSAITYAVLEAYGRLMGVPCGVLLLASRAHAEHRDGGAEGASAFFLGVRGAIDEIEAAIMGRGEIRTADVRLLVERYQHASREKPGDVSDGSQAISQP